MSEQIHTGETYGHNTPVHGPAEHGTAEHGAAEHGALKGHGGHKAGYGVYIMVWLGLVGLTAVTITVSGIQLGSITLITALLIASVKTSLVGYHFMHIKYDNAITKIFILVCLVIFLTFWILLFSDLSFR